MESPTIATDTGSGSFVCTAQAHSSAADRAIVVVLRMSLLHDINPLLYISSKSGKKSSFYLIHFLLSE